MPNIKSAKKRVLIIKRNTARNAAMKSRIKSAIKRFEGSLMDEAKDMEKINGFLRNAVSVIDKAAKKGVIHKNQAARKKSRLMRSLNAVVK